YILADYHLTIVPLDTDLNKGVGTGAYILQEFQPGVRSLVRRNPNYWKQGHAHFDEVETFNVTDVTARTNALLSGQVDAMSRCDLKSIHLLRQRSNINVLKTTGTKHYSLPMLTDTPPYDNNDVRMALKYAINRKDLLERVLQ